MNRKRIDLALLTLAALLLLASAAWAVAPATAPADYTLDWWTVDGGGGTWSDTGGQYVLNGIIGQPDAGVWSDSDYTLTGGFWSGGEAQYCTYIPLVLKE